MRHILGIAAGILFLAGYLPYIRAIVRKETMPSKASWLIWASLDTILLCGMYFKDALNFQVVGAVMGSIPVALLSQKYGAAGWTKIDKICLGGAAFSVVLWGILRDPTASLVLSSCAVCIGAIPTRQTAWKDPSNEDKLSWTLWFVSCVFAMVTIPAWTIADVVQPTAYTAIEAAVMFLLFVKPLISRGKKEGT